MPCRIIGCGHPDRGDDAAGLLVARRLRALGLEAEEHTGDGLSLIERWQESETVILIDAVVTGAAPGELIIRDGAEARPVADVHRSTHAFGVAEALQLARTLDRMPHRLVIYGIEGRRFHLGSTPSPEVEAACESLAQRIAREADRYFLAQ
jgi:hydrogenase maturation protease